MGVGAGLYMYDVVVEKSSRSLSHLLMSSCFRLQVKCLLRVAGSVRTTGDQRL